MCVLGSQNRNADCRISDFSKITNVLIIEGEYFNTCCRKNNQFKLAFLIESIYSNVWRIGNVLNLEIENLKDFILNLHN